MLDNNESILLFIFDGIEFFRQILETVMLECVTNRVIPMESARIKHNLVLSIFSV